MYTMKLVKNANISTAYDFDELFDVCNNCTFKISEQKIKTKKVIDKYYRKGSNTALF